MVENLAMKMVGKMVYEKVDLTADVMVG